MEVEMEKRKSPVALEGNGNGTEVPWAILKEMGLLEFIHKNSGLDSQMFV